MSKIFSTIQDYQDALVQRFCSPRRRVTAETDWYGEDVDLDALKEDCRTRIIFFEARGFYLFQEPQIEHQPARHRLRVLLIFKPTESNGPG